MNRTKHVHMAEGVGLEYSVVGEGIPILVFHGGHSSCDEEFGYKELWEEGYSIITPSRAGYGRTSHEIGANLQTACNAYLGLLNHLGIDRVHVIAMSAGGPSGIYFASLYPERTRSLTLQSAVSREWLKPKDQEYQLAQILFRPALERYTWALVRLMGNLFPKFILKQMSPSFSTLPYADLLTRMHDDDLDKFREMLNRQRSGRGFLTDVAQTKSASDAELQAVRCPTLILHSKHDRAVPVEHAYHAHRHIPGSKLCLLDTWGHLIWLGKGSEPLHHELIRFLKTTV